MHSVQENALVSVLITLWCQRLPFRWEVKEGGWLSQENLVNKKCLSLNEVIHYMRAPNCFRGQQLKEAGGTIKST